MGGSDVERVHRAYSGVGRFPLAESENRIEICGDHSAREKPLIEKGLSRLLLKIAFGNTSRRTNRLVRNSRPGSSKVCNASSLRREGPLNAAIRTPLSRK